MDFLDRLRSLAQARLKELTAARESSPPDLSEVDEEDLVREVVPRKQLKTNLRDDWQHASADYTSSHEGSQLGEELIPAYVEEAARDFILDAAYEEPLPGSDDQEKYRFYCKMFDTLDTSLSLIEVAYEQYPASTAMDPGASTSIILEELGDVLTIESWSVIFGWIERRAEDITLGLQPSKGKALTLLTLFNHLLRQTSYIMVDFKSSTKVLLLRARIHLFIAEWFKLNDMSGVNLRGEYSEMRTRWPGLDGTEEDDEEEKEAIDVSLQSKVEDAGPDGDSANPVKEEAVVAEGDLVESQGLVTATTATTATTTEDEKLQPVSDTEKVLDTKQSDRMEVDLPEEPVKVDDQGAKAEDLYTALYHVQMVFTSPPSLIGNRPGVVQDKAELPMEAFKRRTGIILEEMAKRRAEAIEMAKSMREAALAGNLDDSKNDEYPAFLVSRRTLPSDIANPMYRKRLCAQFLIILEQIVQLTAKDRPRHPKNSQFPPAFVVSAEDAQWAGETAGQIKAELLRLPDGKEFESRVRKMLDMDRHYAIWKQLSCPPFDMKPAEPSTIDQAETNRKRMNAPLRPYRWSAGTKSLSRLGTDPLTGVDQLKGFKLAETVERLKEKYDRELAEEEDEKAMGRDFTTRLGPFVENKASLSWKALRLAGKTDLDAFPKARNGDLPDLIAAIDAKQKEQQAAQDAPAEGDEAGSMANDMDADDNTPAPEEEGASPQVKDELVEGTIPEDAEGDAEMAEVKDEELAAVPGEQTGEPAKENEPMGGAGDDIEMAETENVKDETEATSPPTDIAAAKVDQESKMEGMSSEGTPVPVIEDAT